jgi:hypothetical protein
MMIYNDEVQKNVEESDRDLIEASPGDCVERLTRTNGDSVEMACVFSWHKVKTSNVTASQKFK